MTTFQDPPPQSRRAVRQSERGDSGEIPPGFAQFPPPQPAATPQFFSPPPPVATSEMWDTTARRAAQIPGAPRPDAAPQVKGRRSAAPQVPVGEPLTYTTQSREQTAPSYDPQSFRSRLDARQAREPIAPPAPGAPPTEQPAYRVRDFRPEGRRVEPTAAPAWSPPPAQQAQAAQLPVEQTLSRREFRALLAEEEEAALLIQPPAPTYPPQEAYDPPPVAYYPVPAAPEQVAPPQAAPEQAYPVQPYPEQPYPVQAATLQPVAAPVQAPEYFPVQAPEPSTNTALTTAIAEFDSLTRSTDTVGAVEATAWSPPVGHWSTQADLADDQLENTISRTVGSGHTATSALVLPAIPRGDIRGPLTRTGEIMLTGSIDLPRNLGSTGVTDRFDRDGIDALFDLSDSEVISTDSAPVRAVKAVSTHSIGHGVTHTRKPKGTRSLTVLLISASSLAVVVAGLLVAAFVFRLF